MSTVRASVDPEPFTEAPEGLPEGPSSLASMGRRRRAGRAFSVASAQDVICPGHLERESQQRLSTVQGAPCRVLSSAS